MAKRVVVCTLATSSSLLPGSGDKEVRRYCRVSAKAVFSAHSQLCDYLRKKHIFGLTHAHTDIWIKSNSLLISIPHYRSYKMKEINAQKDSLIDNRTE